MSWAPGHDPQMPQVDAEQALSATMDFWTGGLLMPLTRPGRTATPFHRSVITLKALTYEPTGGIVAAATTLLPEEIGGVRNWDYRYCWLRDATYTLQALLAAGFRSEAGAWRDWLLRAIAGQPETLQILYSLDGARRLPEADLPWLSGYEGSSPVRTGNAASGQVQLDVWGETLDALFLARQAGLPADRDAWALQVALMDYLESAWREPDNGLWEVRGDRRHFTHSKVMAWAAADRMARSVRVYGLPGPVLRWEQLRDQIHQDVVTHAFDAERNTFTQAYGSTALDASLLLIPRVGFLPATDPRVMGTIDAVRRELSDGGLVKRYQTTETDDGLKGSEGLFIACSFWLVDALHASGQHRDAIDLFERLLLLRNDVGLLSEEWDPAAHRQLGNTPQAFSHFALIISALQLHMGQPGPQRQPDVEMTIRQQTVISRVTLIVSDLDRAEDDYVQDLRMRRRATRRHRPGADPRAVPLTGARTALIGAAGPRADRTTGVHGHGGTPVPAGQHEHRPLVPAHGDRRERHDARAPAGHGQPAFPAHQPRRSGAPAG